MITGSTEETEERFQTVDGFAADYYYRCAVMAATLVRLGIFRRKN
ncbi:hypothetical protein [Escherichia coli]